MRYALLLCLAMFFPLFAAEAKPDPAAAPVATAADLKAATKTAIDAARKAMADLRAAQKADIAAGRTAVAGETGASRAADVWAKAQRAAIIAYFSEVEHTNPLPFVPTKAGKADSPEVANIKALNAKLSSLHDRAVAGTTTDPWGKDANAPQDFGAKYGEAAHVEALTELCGGEKAQAKAQAKPAPKR